MCLAIPGKVELIEKDRIIIDYGFEKREANKSVIDISIGDYVIVSNKIIVTKLSEQDAKRFLEIVNAS